ncbi:LAMI_0G14598g1_1 [Lachancea mirantina]|uniref:LAMI_0G14598g1_1 n=1 Tax=Lachancea mirantina TaxID=1230905 RepID=A0A1G4KC66_9SACH|nr:LAMI_0G14598g1_1 [Lachancea mirantina]
MIGWGKKAQAIFIVLTFIVLQVVYKNWLVDDDISLIDEPGLSLMRRSKVEKQYNADASLFRPFLDRINDYWITKGETEIKNHGSIKLSSRGRVGQYGILMSNGKGDNTLDDFEMVIKFAIYNNVGERSSSSSLSAPPLMGDGMAVVITPENGFAKQKMMSSYAKKQYEHSSGGVLENNHDLMGFPKNLAGLAIVLDTYRNDKRTRIKAPLLHMQLNLDPQKHSYSLETDGRMSTGHSLCGPLKLKKSVMLGYETSLRVIYLETIGFLKVDIDYGGKGNWVELFQRDSGFFLPKNKKTGQRFIGIGALNGQLTQTVEVKGIETHEFHLKANQEGQQTEENFDYAKELQLLLATEFQEHVRMSESEFDKWRSEKASEKITTDNGSHGLNPSPNKKRFL